MQNNYQNNYEEKKSNIFKPFYKRINYLLLFIFLLFILLIIRLSFLQIVKGEHYSQQALSRSDKYITIPAMRGRIFSREGNKPIVYNRPSPTAVFTEIEKMKKEDLIKLSEDLEKALKRPREEILKKMDVGFVYKIDKNGKMTIREAPRNSQRFMEKDIKIDLTQKEIAYLSEHHLDFPGISVQTKPIRVYDNRRIAVQTIGYVRPYNIMESSLNSLNEIYQRKNEKYTPNQLVGFEGVELSYEDQLHGKNGKRYFSVDANGNVQSEFNEVPPKKGNDIYLTIDSRMQLEIRDFIQDYLPKIRKTKDAADTKSIYAVAMEVQTGKIVSMISYPEYDPNIWIKGVEKSLYDQVKYYVPNGTIQSAPYDVSPKKGMEALEEIAKHPQSIVPTGSTIKPATLLMGLSEKVISSYEVWQDPPGGYKYGNGTDIVRNDKNHNYGAITPQIALQKSSNTYMARIGKLINDKYNKNSIYIMQKYFHALGLGVKTGIPLPFENHGVQDFVATNRNISSLAAMVQASFGQQERYTAMQLCQYAATVANKGKRMQPQIVDKIVDPSGKLVEKVAPKVMNHLNIPDEIWDTVHEGMHMVTQRHGTANSTFGSFPYRVAA
ncbi:MAG TPA: penicillin-binding protein, partial [Paenibacillaceae bacterium]|nr:penicillin-binding protein [Paenibacillaceae bacterium]